MTRTLALVLASLIPLAALAADPETANPELPPPDEIFRPAGDTELDEFLWAFRALVVFANGSDDPRYLQQIDLLRDGEELLADREVVVLSDTDPAARLPIRLALRPRDFQVVLVDKDGVIMLRKPFPSTVREITRSIDRTPLRLREVEERRQERHKEQSGQP